MVYCRNVQLIPTLFLKLTKIRQRENGKNVDFNDPPNLKTYVPARNAFEYLQVIYIARNYSYIPTFLPLIVWSTFISFQVNASKSNPLDLKLLA